jgi:translation elongation factor P/translation initiation factor 5A
LLDLCGIKAGAVISFQKPYYINKTCQLKPGKGAGIWRMMKPHGTNQGAKASTVIVGVAGIFVDKTMIL